MGKEGRCLLFCAFLPIFLSDTERLGDFFFSKITVAHKATITI